MLKIQSLLLSLGIVFGLSAVAMAQSEQPVQLAQTTQGAEGSEFEQDPTQPATTTQGPEGSEIHYDEASDAPKTFGIQLAVGQTLLSGEEADSQKGFNNALGAGLGVLFRYRTQLTVLVDYWASTHQGIQTKGVLNKSHLTGTLQYYLYRGLFSPFGIIGAGIYFSKFRPGPVQKAAGYTSSDADSFGVVLGVGGEFNVSNNFNLSLNAIRHHSFKYKNAKNKSEELLPFTIIGLMGNFYF